MNQYTEVIKQLLALIETMEEGIIYIDNQIRDGAHENTLRIAEDVLSAFSAVEDSLQRMAHQINISAVQKYHSELLEAFGQLVAMYEEEKWDLAEPTIQAVLLPRYLAWKKQIEEMLSPYIMI